MNSAAIAHSAPDIAIVGMSALFPGAKDLRAYWSNILNKVNAVTDAADDWAHPYYEPDAKTNDRVYTRKGGFLGKLAEFDPLEFGIMPNSVDGGEPDHFLALKLCWEALKDAGYLDRPFDRQKAGIILGRGTYINRGYNTLLQHGQIVDQTLDLLTQLHPNLTPEMLSEIRQQLKASLPPFTAEMAPGLVPNVITGRIANRLDLMGPNYIVDAACASSLIATKLAMQELASGRCDLVLTGGVHASTPPQINMIFCQINALSHDGIAPFGAKAGGTLLGEGLGIVVLKRLADAERDGDRIYAVLKGVGTSSDGKALGLLAPRMEGEVLALERAYGESQIDPTTIGLVEAHGTGIALGDRTEVQSLTQVFGPRQGQPSCALGSVKSMIGHCIPAAGSASLIKMALALYHKILPPTLCEEVNSGLNIENTPFYINTEARPWIHGNAEVPRRAGVNSFGFGGINAHAVLEEYRGPQAKTELLVSQLPTELLTFAGQTHGDLLAQLAQIQQLLTQDPAPALADVAYTLSAQPAGPYRVALVAKDAAELAVKLQQTLEKLQDPTRTRLQTRNGIYYQAVDGTAVGKTAFIFPGEGSQYPNMLADLCCYFPQVRQWFDFLESAVADRRAIAPRQVLFPAPTSLTAAEREQATQILYGMDMASESVFTASMALYELLKTFGVNCDVMVGHSTGENAALIASGTVRMADPTMLMAKIRHLNQIYLDLEQAGGIARGQLLTVGALAPEALAQILEPFGDRVHWAMDNCPNQAVLFAAPDDMTQVMSQLKAAGAICTLLPFDRAYHTSLFAGVSRAFRAFYDGLDVGVGPTPLYSCATAAPFPTDPEEIRALATHQWSARVRFRETLLRLYAEGVKTFIEVGPSANLTGFVTDVLTGKDHVAISSDSARRSGLEHLQHLLARLWVQGNSVNFAPLYGERFLKVLDIPALLASDRSKARPKPILTLTMPTLRLPPEFVADLRAKLGNLTPSMTVLPEPLVQEPTSPPPLLETVAISQPLEPAPSEPLPITPPLPPTLPVMTTPTEPLPGIVPPSPSQPTPAPMGSSVEARSALVQAHLGLMQSFLEQQNRVTTAIYTQLAKDEWAEPGAEANIAAAFSPEQPLSFAERWPLLGQVIHQDAETLQCDRPFTMDQDWFLQDHTLGGVLSQRHPELLPLPVIPFTVSMETLAEAAACLMGGDQFVVGVSNLRGYRWLSLDQGALTISIQAKRLPSTHPQRAEVQVRLYQASAKNPAQKHLVFEGVVQLAEQWQPAPAPMAFALDNPAPSRWSDADLYRTGMFHGSRFQGVTHICGWTQAGIEAELQAIGVDNFFADNARAEFQLDAGLLDAAGQLVGYWVSEQFGTDFNVFPFQVEAFHQYAPPPPPGHKILCRGLMRFLNPKQTTAQFDFLDEQGCLIARLEGWQDRYFNIPHHYYQCRLHPQTAYLSQAWLQAETGVVCRRVNAFPEGFLEDSWSIWQRVLAHLMLNQAERTVWYQFPEVGPRRSEWLLGRIAAKDAVRQWAKQTFHLDLAPVDVEIRAVGQGQPTVICADLAPYGAMPAISISHTNGTAIAVLVPSGCNIGVDLQCMDGLRYEDLVEGIATPKEQQWLAALPVSERLRCLIEFWCAKESLTKALGVGLGGQPKDWEVCQYSPERSLLAITRGAQSVPIQFWHCDNEVLAICQLQRDVVTHPSTSVHTHFQTY
jgi:acyl transferase domain-containing protein/phosphopantetheinyl transferase